jgi:hypothetical protein
MAGAGTRRNTTHHSQAQATNRTLTLPCEALILDVDWRTKPVELDPCRTALQKAGADLARLGQPDPTCSLS